MLGKLLKYEVRSVARNFVPIYVMILVLSGFTGLLLQQAEVFSFTGGGMFLTLLGAILVSLYIALFVITLLMVINRFNKNLLGDEGYLMMTLPVRVEEIIHSKWISAFIWYIFSGIVAGISFLLLFFWAIDFVDMRNAMKLLHEIVQEVSIISILLLLGLSFFSFLKFIFFVYFSLAAAHLPKFNGHRKIWAIAIYIVLGNIVNIVQSQILNTVYDIESIGVPAGMPRQAAMFTPEVWQRANGYLGLALVLEIIVVCGLFYGVHHILSKKLNLD